MKQFKVHVQSVTDERNNEIILFSITYAVYLRKHKSPLTVKVIVCFMITNFRTDK